MKKFILIDGNAIVHRAFHGLPPLNGPSGEQVNAVYGFFSMFLKILQDYTPEMVTVCFDRKAPTFRKEMYVGYQAKRPVMAEGLGPQFDIIRGMLREAKIPISELDGYEADDLIGTLATQIVAGQKPEARSKKLEDVEVIIFSGDRDLLQLVNSHVKMLAPVVGITNMTLFDQQKVEEKYGLKPLQIVDYKALVGDSSDNYPGVSGIGPKTASALLQKYSTLENLYAHIGELPEKVAMKLATDAEQAALCKKLATIVTDAPIHLDLKGSQVLKFDISALVKSFEKYGFKSLVKRLSQKVSKETEETEETKVKEKKNKEEQLGLL